MKQVLDKLRADHGDTVGKTSTLLICFEPLGMITCGNRKGILGCALQNHRDHKSNHITQEKALVSVLVFRAREEAT